MYLLVYFVALYQLHLLHSFWWELHVELELNVKNSFPLLRAHMTSKISTVRHDWYFSCYKDSYSIYKQRIFCLQEKLATYEDSQTTGVGDVSLNCGRFYGPIVRPRMWMNEWIKWMSGAHAGMILTEGLGEKPVPVPLCPPQIPLD
jgi:hypothetical protein